MYVTDYGDVLCLSHLRWDFVYQRPQHLMSRCARDRRVFFIEEPIVSEGPIRLTFQPGAPGVTVCVPHVAPTMTDREAQYALSELLQELVSDQEIKDYV